ncbi:MAG TPA: hypothetical protein VKQ71_03680 [Acidimicrobiales bacterium]|nr:hypothetical protein [Acidimicrobiales bacterium]
MADHLDDARAALDATTEPQRLPRPAPVELGEHLATIAGVDGDSIDLRTSGDGFILVTCWDDGTESLATVRLSAIGLEALVEAIESWAKS